MGIHFLGCGWRCNGAVGHSARMARRDGSVGLGTTFRRTSVSGQAIDNQIHSRDWQRFVDNDRHYWRAGIGIKIASINGVLRGKSTELRSKNAELRSKSDQLVGLANERAGKAEQRAAELLREIQPRRLSPDQEKSLAESLKAYAGKTVAVATYSLDVEAIVLGLQIEKVLTKANIKVWDRLGTFMAMGRPVNLGLIVDTNSPDKKLEAALFGALKTKGGLATTNAVVAFGQGSAMYLPPGPKGSTGSDAFVFIGVKPIAEESPANAKATRTNSSATR